MVPHCLVYSSSGRSSGFTEELNGTGVGDAGDTDEQLQGVLELLVGVDEDAGLLAQVFDLGVESGDAVLQIRNQEVWIRPSWWTAMVTVSWLTSIPALFIFRFSKWLEPVRLMTRFSEPEPTPTNLVYAGSRA